MADHAQQAAQRALRRFEDKGGPLPLACFAALPVAIDPDLLHLIRVNFFHKLPYTAESRLLLSPLCVEIGEGLYEMPLAVRELLLLRLFQTEPEERLRRMARLLWEYSASGVWADNEQLARAQQLTALNLLAPDRAQAWLEAAKEAQRGGLAEANTREWFVAMRAEIERQAEIVAAASAPSSEEAAPDAEMAQKLYSFILNYFDYEELVGLAFDLAVDIHSLPATNRSSTARELVHYMVRRDRFDQLAAELRRQRPEAFAQQFGEGLLVAEPEVAEKSVRDPQRIFISHSYRDTEFAHKLADDLRRLGYGIWISPESIRLGENWAQALDRGLAECGIYLLVLSQAAADSRWVKSETAVAIELQQAGEIRFVPVLLELGRYPAEWQQYQRADFVEDYQAGLVQLQSGLRQTRPALSHSDLTQIATILAKYPRFQSPSDRHALLELSGLRDFAISEGPADLIPTVVVFALNEQGRTPDGDWVLGRLLSYLAADESLPPDDQAALNDIISRYGLDERGSDVTGIKPINMDAEPADLPLLNPQDDLLSVYKPGQVVHASVLNVRDDFAEVELSPGARGRIHRSELAWHRVERATEIARPGQTVKALILSIDLDRQLAFLSLRLPGTDPLSHFAVNQRYTGKVIGFTADGNAAFVELSPGVDGFLYKDEISFQQPPNARALLQEDDVVRVRITAIDPQQRRLRLTARALYESEIWVPDSHRAMVIGSKGETINQIADETGTKLDLTDEGLCLIRGQSETAVDEARRRVERIVGRRIVTFTLTAPQLRRLIGKGGKTIKRIQAETGARIDTSRNSNDVRLTAEDGSALQHALDAVRAAVSYHEARVQVLATAIGKLIGTGGANVKQIRASSGADIDIDRNNPGLITISGPGRYQVDLAISLIQSHVESVDRLSAQDWSLPPVTEVRTEMPATAHRSHQQPRAQDYKALEQYDEALADDNEALRLNPQVSEAIASREQVYHDLARWEEALAVFERLGRDWEAAQQLRPLTNDDPLARRYAALTDAADDARRQLAQITTDKPRRQQMAPEQFYRDVARFKEELGKWVATLQPALARVNDLRARLRRMLDTARTAAEQWAFLANDANNIQRYAAELEVMQSRLSDARDYLQVYDLLSDLEALYRNSTEYQKRLDRQVEMMDFLAGRLEKALVSNITRPQKRQNLWDRSRYDRTLSQVTQLTTKAHAATSYDEAVLALGQALDEVQKLAS